MWGHGRGPHRGHEALRHDALRKQKEVALEDADPSNFRRKRASCTGNSSSPKKHQHVDQEAPFVVN